MRWIVPVPTLPSQIERAQRKMDRVRGLRVPDPERFGYDEERTLLGYVGEILVRDYLGIPDERDEDKPDYDFIHRSETCDAKAIGCNVPPCLGQDATVNSWKREGWSRQKVERYIFVRVLSDLSFGWIVGHITAEKFWRLARRGRKGDRLFAGGPVAIANFSKVYISDLSRPETLL